MTTLIKVLIILLCAVNASFGASLGCPNSEDLFPCSCKRVAYGLHVVCANFNTSSNLLKAFRILRDYRMHTVLLHGLYLQDTLPEDLFTGMQIKEIRVEKSKLRFPQPAFKGLDSSLNVLNVAQKSMIKSNDRFSLARLTNLHELNVEGNRLERVEDKWLNEKVPNVEKIVLDYNEIGEMEGQAFAGLKQLKILSLAENRIKNIKRSMLPRPALQLTRIDLSFNEINNLPYDFFFEMPSLKEIILTGNELTSLQEATWKPVWEQLDQIFLIDNRIECENDIKWMKKYQQKSSNQLNGNCYLPKELFGKSIIHMYDKAT